MRTHRIVSALVGAVLLLQAAAAVADGFEEGPDHFEFTMGFVAGERRYAGESFAHESGGGGVEGAGALVAPFDGAPYDRVTALGLRYDLRLVVSYVRMTVGVDFPFASFEPDDTRGTYDVGGVEREIVVQRLRPYELRFGIGGEYAFARFAPFVDLIGEVDWVKTALAVDGATVEYEASSFGFAVRAGARLHLREWFFVTVAGDVGIVGQRFWDAELSLGFAFG